jgi:hypothetical protein
MPDSSYRRDQAERYDRVADLCSVPELVGYYRQLAEDCNARSTPRSRQGTLPTTKPLHRSSPPQLAASPAPPEALLSNA